MSNQPDDMSESEQCSDADAQAARRGGRDAVDHRRALHVFCDFDGTISSLDVGVDLFRHFGAVEPWLSEADEGRLSIDAFWRMMARGLRAPLSDALLDSYLRTVPVDAGFTSFLDFLQSALIPFTVVSDGLDLYVRPYLAMHGAGHVPFVANHARITPDGALEVAFPHTVEGCCRRFTVACKRNAVLANAHPEARIVYIGDGLSDVCAADHADIIFAKDRLAAYCNEQRLPHYPFRTLADVERQIRLLMLRRRIRPRHQAVLKRKSAWESE